MTHVIFVKPEEVLILNKVITLLWVITGLTLIWSYQEDVLPLILGQFISDTCFYKTRSPRFAWTLVEWYQGHGLWKVESLFIDVVGVNKAFLKLRIYIRIYFVLLLIHSTSTKPVFLFVGYIFTKMIIFNV